jgi:AraC-like DNA-binding protein
MQKFNDCKTIERVFEGDLHFPLKARLEDPQEVTVSHVHDFCECIFVISGSGMHQTENNPPVTVQRGDVLFIPVGGHHAYTRSDALVVCNLLFHARHLPSVLLELYSNPVYKQVFLKKFSDDGTQDFPMTHIEENVFCELENMLRCMAEDNIKTGNHCYKLGLFMAVLSRLCDVWKTCSDEGSVPLDIPKLTAYLEHHFQQKIYLDELTKLAGMSRATLMRHFHAALGVTPMIYLRNLRLRHAAELLLETDLSLKEIADQSGFISMPYFFRIFKSCYGEPPQEYRRRK